MTSLSSKLQGLILRGVAAGRADPAALEISLLPVSGRTDFARPFACFARQAPIQDHDYEDLR